MTVSIKNNRELTKWDTMKKLSCHFIFCRFFWQATNDLKAASYLITDS